MLGRDYASQITLRLYLGHEMTWTIVRRGKQKLHMRLLTRLDEHALESSSDLL